jgi:HicB family
MDLAPYVENLRQELAVAAAAGGEDARALAERLIAPLESATRLALLEALSAAADEITRELAPGSVEVRLRGRDPDFIVTSPPTGHPDDGDAAPAMAPDAPEDGEGRTARITLRVPEHLKPRIDEAAEREALSVNAWLVRAIAAALDPRGAARHSDPRGGQPLGRRYSGWVR